MTLNFCAHCGALLAVSEVTEGLRCDNCSSIVSGPDNHVEGAFDMDGGAKLLKAYGFNE